MDCVPQREFTARVPFRQDKQRTGEEGGFDETDEETDCDHAGEGGHVSGQSRNHAPDEHYDSDVERRTRDLVDDHVGRDLH